MALRIISRHQVRVYDQRALLLHAGLLVEATGSKTFDQLQISLAVVDNVELRVNS